MPGTGIRATVRDFGVAFSVETVNPAFPHPWKPRIGNGTLSLARGLVDVFTPTIAGRKMTDPRAELRLDPAKVNKNGESFIVLEVEPNALGKLDAQSRVEIVQDKDPDLHSDKIGRQPLAVVIFKGRSPVRAFAVAMFNLRYFFVPAVPGSGRARHLFA